MFPGKILKEIPSYVSNLGDLTKRIIGVSRATFRDYPRTPAADELHHVSTDDNIEIGVWRHRPPSDSPSRPNPVLLVHGLGSNHRNLTLDNQHGVAQYLNEKGFDCWAVDLRGRGASESPSGSWTFDDYAKYDLPAVIDYIIDHTDSEEVHWVGHSMGGMLFYALAGSLDYSNKIASGTTLASPIDFPKPRMMERLGSLLHGLPIAARLRASGVITRFLVSGFRLFPKEIEYFLYNPDNLTENTLYKAVTLASAGTSSRVLTQFPKWFVNESWMDESQRVDYRAGISSISVPSLIIAGAADRLSPPQHIKSGYKDLGTTEKRFVIAGKISGYQEDYSHIDLVFGSNARDEIFPLIYDWIQRHPVAQAA